MTMHTIKCWTEQFSEVRSGRKTFEFRKDDRGYRVGDVLDIREFSPDNQTYSGQFELRRVTHILSSGFGLPDGYVVMSMEAIECCGHPVHDGDNGRYILTCCEKYSTPHSQSLVTHIRPARDGDPVCYAWQVCASGDDGAVPVYEGKAGQHIVDMSDIRALVELGAAPAVKTESPWQWWAGENEEWCTVGPENSREAIIQAATGDELGEYQDDGGTWQLSFHIVEARQDPLRLADWIMADDLLNLAEEQVDSSDRTSSEYDDGPWFECSPSSRAPNSTPTQPPPPN